MTIDQSKLEQEYRGLLKPLRFRFFTLISMPSAAFVGLKVDEVSEDSCQISVKGGWRSQNPFKTMYWAAQGMAAELATGATPFAISRAYSGKIRMFVIGTDVKFVKQAKGRIKFICEDAGKARAAIEESEISGKSVNCVMHAKGIDSDGDVVSDWKFEWNFLAMRGD